MPENLDRIFRAGPEVLRRYGLAGVTVTRIADAAGVPRGSVSNNFSVAGLLEALVSKEIARETANYKAVLLNQQGLAVTRLRQFITEQTTGISLDEARRGWLLAELKAQASSDFPKVREALEVFFSGLRGALSDTLTAVSRDMAMGPGFQADQAAELIVSLLIGTRVSAKSTPKMDLSSVRALIFAGVLGRRELI